MRLIYSTMFIILLAIMLPCIVLFLIACANKQTNATKAFKNSNLVSNSNNKSLKTSTIDNEKEYKELHLIQEQFSRQLLLKQNEYTKLCDRNEADSCVKGLEIRGCISCESNMENIKRALPYFEKAYKYGSNSACHMKMQSQRDLENLINSNL